ncbi:MAG: hypothetical protein LAN64_14230 [Acidobacteriia bacterium]|nr:hypothetical protein [Terriglobia bacterium]
MTTSKQRAAVVFGILMLAAMAHAQTPDPAKQAVRDLQILMDHAKDPNSLVLDSVKVATSGQGQALLRDLPSLPRHHGQFLTVCIWYRGTNGFGGATRSLALFMDDDFVNADLKDVSPRLVDVVTDHTCATGTVADITDATKKAWRERQAENKPAEDFNLSAAGSPSKEAK